MRDDVQAVLADRVARLRTERTLDAGRRGAQSDPVRGGQGAGHRSVELADVTSRRRGAPQRPRRLQVDDEAIAIGLEIITDGEATLGADHYVIGVFRRFVGEYHLDSGDVERALPQLQRARDVLLEAVGPENDFTRDAETLLKQAMLERLDALPDGEQVMLKLTLPEEDGFYRDCIEHPKVLKVVALSGGYSREEANARLARQHGMVASFSRALTEGLTAQQSDDEFNAMLDQSIESIFQASST